jgi:hypothetical protein
MQVVLLFSQEPPIQDFLGKSRKALHRNKRTIKQNRRYSILRTLTGKFIFLFHSGVILFLILHCCRWPRLCGGREIYWWSCPSGRTGLERKGRKEYYLAEVKLLLGGVLFLFCQPFFLISSFNSLLDIEAVSDLS